MADILKEIEDDIKEERALQLFRRFAPLGVAIGIGAVLGVAVASWYRDTRTVKEEQSGLVYREALDSMDSAQEESIKKLQELATTGEGNIPALSLLSAGNALSEEGKFADAIKQYDQLAAIKDADFGLKTIAEISALNLMIEEPALNASEQDIQSRFDSLYSISRPFKAIIKEMEAFWHMRKQAYEQAKVRFEEITNSPEISEVQRVRAKVMLELIESKQK